MAESKNGWSGRFILVIWLCMAIFFIADYAFGVSQRGIGVKVKTSSGQTKEIELYSGYHALIIGCSRYNNGWPFLPNPIIRRSGMSKFLITEDFPNNEAEFNKRFFEESYCEKYLFNCR